ncbi:MAG: PASTA domain-containing protein, partial [Actinobacteria bacterium]|nr:PASTA domain-containing protein [Actinomycetota bacterium]
PPPPPPPPTLATCVVPDVKGKKLSSARAAISRAHCRTGKVTRATSRRVKPGRVIAQRPARGARLPAGSRVGLLVAARSA